MPLTIPAEVQTMIDSGAFDALTTLDITFGNGTIIHISTDSIEDVLTNSFGTIDYAKNLRVSGSLNQSITTSVDRVDLSAQNIDLVLGATVLNNAQSLNGADGILSVVFISGSVKKQVTILRGQIANASSNSEEVKFQLVSYLSLSGPVGGWRPLMRHCAWRFKRPGCDSTDPSLTCSHLFEDANGCSNKLPAPRLDSPPPENNQGSFGGFVDRSPVIIGSAITDPQGAIDGGNDFTTFQRQSNWAGRHSLPAENYGV